MKSCSVLQSVEREKKKGVVYSQRQNKHRPSARMPDLPLRLARAFVVPSAEGELFRGCQSTCSLNETSAAAKATQKLTVREAAEILSQWGEKEASQKLLKLLASR